MTGREEVSEAKADPIDRYEATMRFDRVMQRECLCMIKILREMKKNQYNKENSK